MAAAAMTPLPWPGLLERKLSWHPGVEQANKMPPRACCSRRRIVIPARRYPFGRRCPRQIECSLSDPQVGCGAFKQSIEANGWIYRLLEDGNAWRAEYRGLPYGDQGIFVRRGLFDVVGGFPEVSLMEDVFLMRRLRRRSWPVLLPGLFGDARRWQRRGVVRQTLLNWSLLAAARLGVHPDRLARFYE